MDPIEILLYGVIGDTYEGLDARTIRQQVTDSEGPIDLRLNTGGGSVMEGLAMVNTFVEAKAAGRKIRVFIDGLAASMGSVIAMVGDEIIMADSALMMIHNPWDIAIGDAEQLRKKADLLDKIRDQLVGIYAARTGLSPKVLTAMMQAETWMTADEALENKFITTIAEADTAQASIKPVDVSTFGFAHVPLGNPFIVNTPAAPVAPTAQASIVSKEKNVDPELINKILAFAGQNKVSAALQAKALTGEITYDEMVAQHNSAVAAAAEVAATAQGSATTAVSGTDVTRILAYVDTWNVANDIRNKALTGEISYEQMVGQHTDAVAQADQASGISTIRTGRTLDASPAEEARMRAQMLTVTTLNSIGVAVPQNLQPDERTRAYGEQSMRSVCTFFNQANGIILPATATDRQVISAAFSARASTGGVIGTGDLGEVIGTTLNVSFNAGFQSRLAQTNYQRWTSERKVKDFKLVKSVHIGMFSGVRKHVEGLGMPLAKIGAGARYLKLETNVMKISLTREEMINDEFNAVNVAANKLGVVYGQVRQNTAVDALIAGTMLTDAGAEPIFGEEYSNYFEVAAIDKDTFRQGRLLLRSQKTEDGFRMTGELKVIICAPDLEDDFLTWTSNFNATEAGNVSTVAGKGIEVVALDDLPPGRFYFCGPSQLGEVIETIVLESNPNPQFWNIDDPERLSKQWGTLDDFAAAGIGREGIVMGQVI